MKKKIVLLVTIVLAMCMICACGKKTLESSLSSDDRSQIDQMVSAYAASEPNFKSVTWKVKDNDLTFSYQFSTNIPTDQFAQVSDMLEAQLSGQYGSFPDQLKKEYDLSDTVNFHIEILNDDGSELATYTLTSK